MDEIFGLWLIAQHRREDAVGMLAFQARRDATFPYGATPDEVGAYLKRKGAQPDALDTLEAAAIEWGHA
ncbi:hypothetical protein [uncultured Sphingomonas sp.]|uniref:hypothetical protein n=1 Tax=uncultured Sphingomonas sp. TaxID=158754 RepID=UPI00374A6AF0